LTSFCRSGGSDARIFSCACLSAARNGGLAVNKMALALKYTTPTEKQVSNEKYHFRCWLLRLGFIGEEYKASRKVFLDRLSGDCAFRSIEQTLQRRKGNASKDYS